MTKKFLRLVIIILLSALLIWRGVVFLLHFWQQAATLEVDFLDVGQGDSTLIKTPDGSAVLIDGGPDNQVLRRLGENLPFYRRRLDYLILSHYHDDHVTGLIEVTKRYQVKKIIYESGNEPTLVLKELIAVARAQSVPILVLDNQAKISLGPDCALSLLNPHTLSIKDDDPNDSLAAKLDCAQQKFLFTGDDSAQVEKALIASGWDLRADVLKAAHHGSNSANSAAFLQAVAPKLIVISVGADNKFGHPSPLMLERANALGIMIKRTDQSGSVKIVGRLK